MQSTFKPILGFLFSSFLSVLVLGSNPYAFTWCIQNLEQGCHSFFYPDGGDCRWDRRILWIHTVVFRWPLTCSETSACRAKHVSSKYPRICRNSIFKDMFNVQHSTFMTFCVLVKCHWMSPVNGWQLRPYLSSPYLAVFLFLFFRSVDEHPLQSLCYNSTWCIPCVNDLLWALVTKDSDTASYYYQWVDC